MKPLSVPPPAAAPRAWIDEVARHTYRINIGVPPALAGDALPGGFSYNQYLIDADEPLLFHTGPRRFFGLVREQVEKVLPLSALRWIGFSHVEGDECGSLAEFAAAAPQARPVCSRVGAANGVADMTDAVPRALADGEVLDIGGHRLRWIDTPHLPHGWDCGYLFDECTGTLLCGDLFTQPGMGERPLVGGDLGRDLLLRAEALRAHRDDFSHSALAAGQLDRLAALRPEILACMHGSAWTGDGAALLRRLAVALAGR